MKRKFKTVGLLIASFGMVTGLASCSNKKDEEIADLKAQLEQVNQQVSEKDEQIKSQDQQIEDLNAQIAELEEQLEPEEYEEVDLESARIQASLALEKVFSELDLSLFDANTKEQFESIKKYGATAIENADNVDTIYSISNVLREYVNHIIGAEKGANGAYSFVAATYEERTKILGILEKYAIDHFLTGFSLIDDGGYALYRPEVTFGTDTYITNYGWGIAGEGAITADLENETNSAWKRYYHTFETSDPASINYGDDQGSVVGDLVEQVGGTYWGTRMNETKDGYEYYSMLAKDFPIAVNKSDKTGLASEWKWRIKTGSEAKYTSLSSNATYNAYNGKAIEAEDYLTPFKMLWTKANGWARATDNHGSSAEIVGEADYYNASGEGYDEEAFSKTGVKVVQENGEWYFHVTYKQPCNAFYARYYINSSIYSPVPMSFVKDALGEGDFETGCKLFGKTNIDKKLSPVDTYLSTGPFAIEAWDNDEQIVFKKNPNYTEEGRFNIAGYHYDILKAANTDSEAAFKEFQAGNLHSCSIPSTQLKEYKNYNNTDASKGFVGVAHQVPGSSNYKLNVNSCTQDMWEYLFGVNGTICQTAVEDYWICEPAMSNKNFLLGLSYAINRVEFADTMGRGASIAYFGNAYMSDPENGVAYNDTEAHAEAINDLVAVGDGYGYDLETAKTYFDKALKELTEEGLYAEGDTINLEIAWQTQSQFTTYGDPIISYWNTAFKEVGEKYGITLNVVNWAGAVWSDVYYSKMMVGQYDIGFGSISGNALNPLNFMEVLKSDNSSGFTLNWGSDTSSLNLSYNGQLWSYDALWKAADQGGYFENGVEVPLFNDVDTINESFVVTANADGSATVKCFIDPKNVDDVEVTITGALVNGYNAEGKYFEDSDGVCTCELKADGYLYVEVPAEIYEVMKTALVNYLDITFKNYVLDVPAETVVYCEYYF